MQERKAMLVYECEGNLSLLDWPLKELTNGEGEVVKKWALVTAEDRKMLTATFLEDDVYKKRIPHYEWIELHDNFFEARMICEGDKQ